MITHKSLEGPNFYHGAHKNNRIIINFFLIDYNKLNNTFIDSEIV